MEKRWEQHRQFLDETRSSHGLFSAAEWQERGFSRGQLRTLMERGFVVRVFNGIYALAGMPRTPGFWVRAGCLRGQPLAAGFAGTAAAVWGLLPERLPVHIATRRRLDQSQELRFHRVALPRHHIIQSDGLWVTTIERTLLDACAYIHPKNSWRLVRRAVRLGATTGTSLDAFTEEEARQGRSGIRIMRYHLERLGADVDKARSDFEDDVFEALVNAGFTPPERNFLIDSGRGFPWEVDLIWPSLRLIIECDHSGTHGEDTFHKDRDKRLDLEAMGYTVISLTEEMFKNRTSFLARLRNVYDASARRARLS